ncbi:MAG: hypothetical protein ACYCSQ_02375 [bacterium]
MEFKQSSKNFRRFYPLIVLLLFFAFIPLALSGCGGGGGGSSSSGSSSTPSATTSTVSGVYSYTAPPATSLSISSFTFTLDANGQFSYIDNLGDTAAGSYTLSNNVLTISSGYICAPTSSTSNCSNGGGTSYAIPGNFTINSVVVGFPSTWNITTSSSGAVTSLSSDITVGGTSIPVSLSPSLGLTNAFFPNGINNISRHAFSTVSLISGATLNSTTGDYELTINGSTFYLPIYNYDSMTINGTANSSYNPDGSIGFSGTTTFPTNALSFTGTFYPGSLSAGEFDMTETDNSGNQICNDGLTVQWVGTASILDDNGTNYITYTIYPDIPPADINMSQGCGPQSNTLILS